MTRSATSRLAAPALLVALLAALPARAADKDVVAKIGTESITEGELNLAAADLSEQFAKLPPEERRLAVLSALIDIKSLAQEAQKSGLEKDPVVKARLAFLRARALHNAYFQKNGADAIGDADLKARYERIEPVEEIHARHILVKTKEEAEAVIKELKGGADFMTLAQAKSSGPSGPQGGDLGFFGPGQMVPPFEKAAFALAVGTYTEVPVQTPFGWHVIEVTEKRKQPLPPLDKVKNEVRQLVMRETYTALVQKARTALKVVYVEPALKSQVEALEKAMADGALDRGEAGPPAEAPPAN